MSEWFDRGRLKAAIGWVLYAGAMLAVFLVITFPFDQLQARVLAELSRSSGLRISAERWSLAWPAGLAWHEVGLAGPDLPRVHLERFELSLLLASLLEGRPGVEGKADVGGGAGAQHGRILSRVTLTSWSQPVLARVAGTAERVDLAKLGVPSFKRGVLRAEFAQQWAGAPDPASGSLAPSGEGQAQVELTGVALDSLPIGPVTIPSVEFSRLTVRLQCREASCRIEGLEGQGPDGTVSGTGMLALRSPLGASELTLALTVTVSPDFVRRALPAGFALASPGIPLKLTLLGPLSKLRVTL